jgi:hypothetical protein
MHDCSRRGIIAARDTVLAWLKLLAKSRSRN